MFSITFLTIPWEYLDEGSAPSAIGEIVIDDFREEFLSSLFAWTPEAYARQWGHALDYLISQSKPATLITEYTGAKARLWAWVLYPELHCVHVQQRIFAFLDQPIVADPYDYNSYVEPLQLKNETGEEISTWTVPLAEVQAFAATLLR